MPMLMALDVAGCGARNSSDIEDIEDMMDRFPNVQQLDISYFINMERK